MATDLVQVFPCITPQSYLLEIQANSHMSWELGNGLLLMLWEDRGGMTKLLLKSDLRGLAPDEDSLLHAAMENLNRVLNEGGIPFEQVGFGTESILVAGPHWLASAVAMHGGLQTFIAKHVGSTDIRVVLPERDRAIFYSKSCSESLRGTVDKIASDMARASRKPFGICHFEYSANGMRAIEEA